jgi:error-prone DNA polymerase
VHASGFRQSPYADIKPQGVDAADTRAQASAREAEKREAEKREAEKQTEKKPPPSKLWHSSPGSSGW